MRCMICWECIETESLTLSCCPSLCYHKECIINWFKRSITCPYCRRENEFYKTWSAMDCETTQETIREETIETINPNKIPMKIFAISTIVVMSIMIVLIFTI